jgi:glycosyltransferase involved in cell wall biosynthesis
MAISSQHPDLAFEEKEPENAPHLMLFAPWYYGHHPIYLRHLIRYWGEQKLPGRLSIVVMPTFLAKHEDVVNLASEQERQTVKFFAIAKEEEIQLASVRPNFLKAFVQYQLIVRYARKLGATQGLLMHFDSCQIPIVLGLPLPCPFSAIYFRPTFHYQKFSNYSPTGKERRQHLQERVFLSRIFAHNQFRKLFCLDPIAVDFIDREFGGSAKVVHMPDPVEKIFPAEDSVRNLKSELGIEPTRKVILAFGILAGERKGTRQFLEALSLLESELCQKICILLVGEPFPEGQATLESWLTKVRQSLPVQVITRFGYVPESDVPLYFQLSDFVVAPYQKHAGMSGIVLLAAAAKKPILSSNYGLMGELVQKYRLGIAVDTTIVSEISKGLTRLLSEPLTNSYSLEGMTTFTELNSPQKFASSIFQNIYNN